jgi:transcriptional regulator with XRE-family HTH domain
MNHDKMSSPMDEQFSDWLLNEMSKRKWSQADLARASGLNRQSISDYVNRRRTNPEPEALVAIAHGLTISPITIFRQAGLLPNSSGSGEQVKFEDWEFLLKQMSPEDEAELRQIAELKIERRKKEQSLKTLKTKKAG